MKVDTGSAGSAHVQLGMTVTIETGCKFNTSGINLPSDDVIPLGIAHPTLVLGSAARWRCRLKCEIQDGRALVILV